MTGQQRTSDGRPSDLISDLPGFNHRPSVQPGHVIATLPTFFGPVDVQFSVTGTALPIAVSNGPVEAVFVVGQSNTYAGRTDDGSDNGLWLRGIWDRYRAFRRSSGFRYSDGSGANAPYAPGSITAMVPAGQDIERRTDYSFTPDAIIFSRIAWDQYYQRPQTVYFQLVVSKASTPLTEYLPGTVKGNSVLNALTDAAAMIRNTYARELILRAPCLIGHEDPSHEGYDNYSSLLVDWARQICDHGATLEANLKAGVRPKVIAYQPLRRRGRGRTPTDVLSSAHETLTVAKTHADVVCCGPAYMEKTAQNGIHARAKIMTGELYAYVADKIRNGEDFQPLHIDGHSATLKGNILSVSLLGPPGWLMDGTDWLPPVKNGGIYYDDDDHSAKIISVRALNKFTHGDNLVRKFIIRLTSQPKGKNPTLYVGGLNNIDQNYCGAITNFYVSGPPSFWHRNGFSQWTTPEIRFWLCHQICSLTFTRTSE